jgi:hypothetical protein
MDDYTKDPSEWRMSSECTFLGARILFQSKTLLVWFPAAVLGHLALEQLLKSAVIQAGCPVTKGRPARGPRAGPQPCSSRTTSRVQTAQVPG